MTNNTPVRSTSFESLGSANISLESDIKFSSSCSTDVVLGQLNDNDDFILPPLRIAVPSLGDEESLLDIDEPLENLGVLEPISQPKIDTNSIETIFEPEQELALLKEVMGACNQADPRLGGVFYDNDIRSLMTSDILEVDPETAESLGASIRRDDDDNDESEDEYAAAAVARANKLHAQPQTQPKPQSQDNAIARIMGYLHHTERDRHLVQQAEEIVRDCYQQYQRGKKRKYSCDNLSGTIFERLVGLMGGERFHEVFHNSMDFDTYAQAPYIGAWQYAPPPSPETMQVAIAYGIHIARLNQMNANYPPESPLVLVQQGVAGFNAMNVEERRMFWNYSTQRHH